MANKRVSELNALTDPASADLLLVADITAQESKKLTLSDLSTFVLSGGSLTGSLMGSASYADNAATASFILQAVSSSYALNSTNSQTASYILGAVSAISASYSSTSSISAIAFSQTGGTLSATTASIDGILSIGAASSLPEPLGRLQFAAGANDYTQLFMSGTVDRGEMIFRSADNGTEPFVFQTWASTNGELVPNERFRITATSGSGDNTALIYARGTISASIFSSSKFNAVGFYGTASYSMGGPGSGFIDGGSFNISSSYSSGSTSASYALSSSHSQTSDLADFATSANTSNTVINVPVGINVMKTLAYGFFTSSADGGYALYNSPDALLTFNVSSVIPMNNTVADGNYMIQFSTPVATTLYSVIGSSYIPGSTSGSFNLMITSSTNQNVNGFTASVGNTDDNPHHLQFVVYSL